MKLLQLFLLLSALSPAIAAGAKPNLVIIFIDDMGYGDIGPFGATKQKTPELDRMAAEGMKLTSFYAAPVCSVSRAQLLTGCYGPRIDVPGEKFRGRSSNGRIRDWIEELDWSTGRVLATLRESAPNTLVIFTSDNGPWLIKGADSGSSGPLRGGKGSTWEGGVRVPTIAWWPGKIEPNTTVDAIAGTIDLLPTAVALAGGTVPPEPVIDGRDLSQLLLGKTRDSPRGVQYYFSRFHLDAVRKGPWKLALAPQNETMGRPVPADAKASNPRLYNLDREIGEKTNLAADHPEIVKELTALADQISTEIGGTNPAARRPAGKVASPSFLYPSEGRPKAVKGEQNPSRPRARINRNDASSSRSPPVLKTTPTTMKQKPTALPWITTLLSLALLPLAGFAKPEVSELYTQKGSDPSFESLLENKEIPIGVNSKTGIKGSKISVRHDLLEKSVKGRHPIPKDISIHTLGNSVIPRKDFPNWTRWYQEDGNTQIFRLFKGEYNVRNTRKGAPRVEAFSKLKWGRGDWHEWEGTYTIVKPLGCAIFQAKSPKLDWSVMINLTDQGDIVLNHRRHQEDKTIAKNMVGKSFLLKVRDNGHEYEVFFNGEKVGAGHYDRQSEQTNFRWGMYRGSAASQDGLLFVTGARFK